MFHIIKRIKFIKYLIQIHCYNFSITNITSKEECISLYTRQLGPKPSHSLTMRHIPPHGERFNELYLQ